MHHIKMNGFVQIVWYFRDYKDIQTKPHIYPYSDGHWAVSYLIGKQSRIRTSLLPTLAEAIKYVNSEYIQEGYRRKK